MSRNIGKQQLSYLQIIEKCNYNYIPTTYYAREVEKAKDNFTKFLDYLEKEYSIDEDSVYLNLGVVEFKNIK